jgi:membrane-bound lytic murein transglycosylase B
MIGGILASVVPLSTRGEAIMSDTERSSPKAPVLAIEDQAFFDWATAFRGRAQAMGISTETLEHAFADLRFLPDVIAKDRNQSEFVKPIWAYLDAAVSDERIANGRLSLQDHSALLARIEALYGVSAEVVVAIWGLESRYGMYRGDIPAVSALATLAYDGRRAAFFEGELMAALRILQAGDVTPDRMRGSWAGAMGHTQFIPTSYLAHAVDFTGDGRRDIWGDDPSDALASTAAYLATKGWRTDQTWGLEVSLPIGFDYALSGKTLVKPTRDWVALGVRRVDGGAVTDPSEAALLVPAGAEGPAFLIFANFKVISTYNNADAYVIAVGHLADRLRGGGPIQSEWPRADRALTRDQRMELQKRLTDSGFDTGGIDGMFGQKSIAALRAFQDAVGLPADGYPSELILERLR